MLLSWHHSQAALNASWNTAGLHSDLWLKDVGSNASCIVKNNCSFYHYGVYVDGEVLIFRIYGAQGSWCQGEAEYSGGEREHLCKSFNKNVCVCVCVLCVCVWGPPVGPSIPLLDINSGQMWPLPFHAVHLVLSSTRLLFLTFFGKPPPPTFTPSSPSPRADLSCQVQSHSYGSERI